MSAVLDTVEGPSRSGIDEYRRWHPRPHGMLAHEEGHSCLGWLPRRQQGPSYEDGGIEEQACCTALNAMGCRCIENPASL